MATNSTTKKPKVSNNQVDKDFAQNWFMTLQGQFRKLSENKDATASQQITMLNESIDLLIKYRDEGIAHDSARTAAKQEPHKGMERHNANNSELFVRTQVRQCVFFWKKVIGGATAYEPNGGEITWSGLLDNVQVHSDLKRDARAFLQRVEGLSREAGGGVWIEELGEEDLALVMERFRKP